ncbi:unnamed protein product [Mesocestoides corti]|uniref:SH2 domain-containing protein n=1 Tax=Mesocestoides corti TaxID=53468 RepID=A0A158QVG0_MESCO|nr:unnamed protein product [Mesocestoides corti]
MRCPYAQLSHFYSQCLFPTLSTQAEELNAIIGDAFKLAYAKQRLHNDGLANSHLPGLSSLYAIELPPDLEDEEVEKCAVPPLLIPPPPPTSPPPPPISSASPPLNMDVEIRCNGRGVQRPTSYFPCAGRQKGLGNSVAPTHLSSAEVRRITAFCLTLSGVYAAYAYLERCEGVHLRGSGCMCPAPELDQTLEDYISNPVIEAKLLVSRALSLAADRQQNRFRSFSGKPSLVSSGLRRQWLDSTNGDSTDEGPAQADKSENSGARQRALSDPKAPPHPLLQPIRHSVAFFESPPAPKLAEDLQAPPPPSIPIASVSIKDKHRAIFDFPLGDHPISSTAASPVVVLKAHLDSLAEDAKKQAKQPLKKPETPSGAASRFRLRQGVGGGKKRQLERPLSQIICQLDSALLLNNSPSFSVQPRSEERLSAMEPTTSNTSNSHSAFEEEEESGEQLSSMMEPPTSATVEKDCDGVDGPPIPPVRVHSLRRGGGGSCGGDFRHSSSGASPHVARRGVATPLQSLNKSPGGGEETAWNFETDTKADDSPRRNLRLADVCPVPNVTYPGALMDLATYVPGASPSPGEAAPLPEPPCPLHAGLESPSAVSVNGGNQQRQTNAWWPPNGSHQPLHRPRLTGETPTPTATPTPTPTPAPLIPHHTSPSWFQAYLPREVALELLTHEEAGSFLVRDSVTQPGCWALSVRVPTHVSCVGITHYLIQHSRHGVKLKGLDKEWPSLEALITHLTVMPEMLPCPLRLPSSHSTGCHTHHSSNPTFTEDEHEGGPGGEGVEEEDDAEYQRLSDFSSMLADMQSTPTAAASQLFR